MKDSKTYFYHLAMDVQGSLQEERLYNDSVVHADDLLEYRGMCQLDLYEWPEPVLVLYAKGCEFSETDPGAEPPSELTTLREGLAACGLVELSCYLQHDSTNDDDVDEEGEPVYRLDYDYALVVQLAPTTENDSLTRAVGFSRATGKVAKLFWSLAAFEPDEQSEPAHCAEAIPTIDSFSAMAE